jgi:SAM-dependent methyltransferase
MSGRVIATVKYRIRKVLNVYPFLVRKREFERQSFRRFNERAVEFAFVFRQLVRLCPQHILDVGTGMSALPQLMRNCGCVVTATDNVKDYWPAGMFNPHYYLINDDITDSQLEGTFGLITCISVLEHIEKAEAAVRNMFRLLGERGHLILTFPYTEHGYVPNVYKLPGSTYGQDAPYVCRSYSRNELTAWLRQNGGIIIEQEYWQFWKGDYWTMGNQVTPPRQVDSEGRHQLSCLLIQKTAQSDT